MSERHSVEAIDTGAFLGDGQIHTWRWTNPYGNSIYIKQVELWHGMAKDWQADFMTKVWHPRGPLISRLDDNYVNPSGDPRHFIDYGADFMALHVHESIQLDSLCAPLSDPAPPWPLMAHVVLTFWYTE